MFVAAKNHVWLETIKTLVVSYGIKFAYMEVPGMYV
jgi:hypothetical protein